MSNELKTTERDVTINPRQLRAAGYIPATISNAQGESKDFQIRAHEFTLLTTQGVREFRLTGFVSGTSAIKQVQKNPVSQEPLAVQFIQS